MCGIVAAITQRDVVPMLMQGLQRLEYRGYDSTGIAVLDTQGQIQRRRTVGKVAVLEKTIAPEALSGTSGIAHTRWATHGKPNVLNAHPHTSGTDIALVHNGIIENYLALRAPLIKAGYQFESDTDSEVIAHLFNQQLQKSTSFLLAVLATIRQLEGSFALVFLCRAEPNTLIAVRKGSPLVVGFGSDGHYIASDQLSIAPFAEHFVYLEEGDVAQISKDKLSVFDEKGLSLQRLPYRAELQSQAVEKGIYRHFMEKEIFEQVTAVKAAFDGRIESNQLYLQSFDAPLLEVLSRTSRVQIVACGTSYHAGLIASRWLEGWVKLPCRVMVASEFRYQETPVESNTLFLVLSQSGETADTLAALRKARNKSYVATLAICNVPESAMQKEADFALLTRAGPEIGVASTKAFTTQLVVLSLLTTLLGRSHGWSQPQETEWLQQLQTLPTLLEQVLKLDPAVKQLAQRLSGKSNALFIARGILYPVALEAALKLKELSYIHAEAHPAGELKHGPLALIDATMPIVTLLPNNFLKEKLKATIQEVRARGGQVVLFTQTPAMSHEVEPDTIVLPPTTDLLSPMVFTVALQLLAYHVAVFKGTDVDCPRNLAKSVTVE